MRQHTFAVAVALAIAVAAFSAAAGAITPAPASAPPVVERPYDLLIANGRVIDPANNRDGMYDVAVKNGRIAEVSPHIEAYRAKKVVWANGKYVTPGLVDIHTHVYAGTGKPALAGDASVYPDGFTFRSCVTTAVDAGTSGWRNFPDFKWRVIDRAKTRVLAFLNIVGTGMGTESEQDTREMNPEAATDMVARHRDLIVGIKTAHFEGPAWTAIDRAVDAGTRAGVPVMVDFGVFRAERHFQTLVLEKLRPGDIYTHFYHPSVPLLDERGTVRPYLARARQRGVKFDLGHGGGSFVWKQAFPAVRQGLLPDSLSTDLHTGSMNAGMKDMMNVVSKFLSLDVPVRKVVEMTTVAPAFLINRRELGNLSVGAPADIAVFEVMHGKFGYLDVSNMLFEGSRRAQCEMTIRGGEIVWDLNGAAASGYYTPTR